MNPDVVVIGAGFAGLSAAVKLAEAGLRVTVLEQAPRLGGRATSFVDKTTGDRVDNGQHALFGCYTETYAFLKMIGAADKAPLETRLELVMAGISGPRPRLSCPPLPAPMHLLAGVLSWSALPVAERWSTVKMAPFLRDARRRGAAAAAGQVPDHLTVAQWLRSLGQGPQVCDWLWYPLTLAALNQSADVAGARPFARVLAELFGPDPGASSIGTSSVPLDELYAEPAARFIESRGGQVLRQTPAKISSEAIFEVGSSEAISSNGRTWSPRNLICAVPWFSIPTIWSGQMPSSLESVAKIAQEIRAEPIVSVNLWFDSDLVLPGRTGLVGTRFQWAFKNELGGEFSENRLRARFRVAMVASGARDILRMENDALIGLAERELRQCLPDVRSAERVHAVVVREPRATFSVAPGSPARPGPVTEIPGFFLAGDWTDTGLPATIEGAVRSGHAAAEAVLRR